ncbi:alpha-E domain-containing protein [Alteraurantiacibacter aquimixticola]|uniref:Alpha-E domain-containing protein n=1 Tax=Alteraurantiacibacter aquimixticola TaxID=2489173 RepID=A0A4T3F150_9SPHN|nr:alpha-E domain-containing protein [Alteraurantiacibacter aquimixticola]TIX50799.1 alpha-E domain-containing protein [Alteraurantiacibacter aquimixticola]
MLGRVANGIFWMYRYLERAENTARLLAAGHRMALTRGVDEASEEWRSVLTTLGLRTGYDEHYDDYTGAHVCDFVLRSKNNPESVLSMFERARTNARACRSAITLEVWEAINEGWMTLCDLLARPVRESNLNTALGAIRRESSLARGATHGSMLRNETYSFARAGTFLERADNTARILDVKYYLLLPSLAYVGTALDTGQWDNVLRSLSAERAYRWLNAGRMDARSIADFLILDERFPRSLAFCYSAMRENLSALSRLHGKEGSAHEAMRIADQQLTGKSVEDIFDQGLHEFLLDFIGGNASIASAIAEDYRFVS